MSGSTLGPDSTVLGIITHFACEAWLADALDGLTAQTRPLDGIVVVDDCSNEPPTEVVRRYPNVTLLGAAERAGTYRLKQQVIHDTDYDAYLFEDADDWSTADRLELLLAEAERTQAELVGSYELQIWCDRGSIVPFCLPTDVNAAMAFWPGVYPLIHPTSLVGRDLVMRIGGFSTGLRFGGDTDLLVRAHNVARIVNVPQYCHVRRKRPGSLTSSPHTGLNSVERLEVDRLFHERAAQNAAAVSRGEPPDVTPHAVADPVRLFHLMGPELNPARRKDFTHGHPNGGRKREVISNVSSLPSASIGSSSAVVFSDPSRPPSGHGSVDISAAHSLSPEVHVHQEDRIPKDPFGDGLTGRSSVLAIVRHYRHNEWLASTLESLVAQTRAPDAIVVVVSRPLGIPIETVRRFPQVTLLGTTDMVGPYSLVQQVIEQTGYDAYLFQESGDWSAPDRLQTLLGQAARSGAELVGSYAVHVDLAADSARPVAFPLDVNAFLDQWPAAHPMFLPTSIVARRLVTRIGGFATGMGVDADIEFVLRANNVANICNVPRYCYIRRCRGSWVRDLRDVRGTSEERLRQRELLHARWKADKAAAARGEAPNLSPTATTAKVDLVPLLGPVLKPPPQSGSASEPLSEPLTVLTPLDH